MVWFSLVSHNVASAEAFVVSLQSGVSFPRGKSGKLDTQRGAEALECVGKCSTLPKVFRHANNANLKSVFFFWERWETFLLNT